MSKGALNKQEEESRRLKTLKEYMAAMDSSSSECFDDIILLISYICNVPYVLVSFLEKDQQTFKSQVGIQLGPLPNSFSFCWKHLVEGKETLVLVEDASLNAELKSHPLVAGDHGIKFILSIPLVSPGGYVVGSVLLLDTKPKKLNIEQIIGSKTMCRQIISQLELNKKTEEQNKLIIQCSKLNDLGSYAATIAHEINTPLAVLSSQSSIIDHKAKTGDVTKDQIVKFSEVIERNVQRISKIVKGLKNVSRNSVDDPFEPVTVRSIFEDTSEICKGLTTKNNVALEFLATETLVACRQSQIAQVLINLVGNASDAVADLPIKKIVVACVEKGDNVEISVTDSGNGIPEEIRKKMFNDFFTTKEVGKGTGIGLSVSYKIVKDHNGSIFVDDKCKNTRIVVSLPKTQPVL